VLYVGETVTTYYIRKTFSKRFNYENFKNEGNVGRRVGYEAVS
jgi:hypothetical protein